MTGISETSGKTLRELAQLGQGEAIYGVIDGAQDIELAYEAKCLYGQDIRMLFEGEVAPALAEVAPYLVPVEPETRYLENWETRRGKNAGILLVTEANADQVYQHLREIFVVQDENGQEYFFRFYDPRVLRIFLPTCRPDELQAFFGSAVRRIICDNENGDGFVCYECSRRRGAE